MVRHAKAAGEHFAFRCPLDADFSVSQSWAGDAIKSSKTPAAPELPEIGIASGPHVELDTQGLRGEGTPRCRARRSTPKLTTPRFAPKSPPKLRAHTRIRSMRPLRRVRHSKRCWRAIAVKRTTPAPAPPPPQPSPPRARQSSSTTGSPHGASGQPRGQVLARFVYDDPSCADPNYLLVEKRVDGAGKRSFFSTTAPMAHGFSALKGPTPSAKFRTAWGRCGPS